MNQQLGLAQLGRNAIERVSELERAIAERDETIRQLRARAVNAEADNGQLTQGAKLSPQERIEFGKLVVRLGVRNVMARLRERDELRAEAAKWERLHDDLYAEIASEHRRDEYGETETAAECVGRIIRERDQLRAQLDEYEREKLKRESQEPVAFRWLGPGNGWRAVYAEPPVPHVDPDWLQSLIRQEIGGCSRELAEKIAEAINGRAK